MNNNEALSVDDDDDDDDNDAADDNDGPSTLKKLIFANGSIFEDDMIEKYTTETGQSRWKCKWCNNSFAVWNATKAIYHVNKISKDICPCTARIDSDHVSKYKAFYEVITKKRSRGLKTTDHLDRSMSSHNLITASTLDSDRRKKSKGNNNSTNRSSIWTAKENSHLLQCLNICFKLIPYPIFATSSRTEVKMTSLKMAVLVTQH